MVQVVLNGKEEEMLVDRGCGQTLVCRLEGHCLWENLQLKCIHTDVSESTTARVHLPLAGHQFQCMVRVLSQLDCPVLLGYDFVPTA